MKRSITLYVFFVVFCVLIMFLFTGCPDVSVPAENPNPTPIPSENPTGEPTTSNTATPTISGTAAPTAIPTVIPSAAPTGDTSPIPTNTTTAAPTLVSTPVPTIVPTTTPSPVPTTTPVTTPASPSNLVVTANSPTYVRLTWTDNSSNETGFEIQREHTTLTNAWTTVATVTANTTSYNHTSLSETWPGYRIRALNSAGASLWTTVVYAPPKLRIINDLYNGSGQLGDWGQLNNIVRIRIASTESLVINDSSNTYERLCPYDSVSNISLANWISPSYTSASTYEDFPVSTYAGIGTNYWVYIQCGWWEYDAYNYWWIKRVSQVLCNNGACCCYKWVTVNCTHTSGYLVINASSFLPHGSWNGSV